MPVEEAARHQLFDDLESALGPESTSPLMSLLPSVGWADVATRQDRRRTSARYRRSTWSAVTPDSRPRVSSTRAEARTTIS